MSERAGEISENLRAKIKCIFIIFGSNKAEIVFPLCKNSFLTFYLPGGGGGLNVHLFKLM